MKTEPITVRNLGNHTPQEVFDYIVSHLLKQGKRSYGAYPDDTRTEGCLYRGPDNLKCAAGCLIPDDLYSKELEGDSWGSVSRKLNCHENHAYLISQLQKAHDAAGDGPDGFECLIDRLRSLAEKSGLNTQVIDRWEASQTQP